MQAGSAEHWRSRLAIPAYRVGEAASYARISPQTVAAWHKTQDSSGRSALSAKASREGLSFLQLIEVAVVAEMRRAGVKLDEIRRARDYFKMTTGLEYPFAQLKFKTDGADILSEVEGGLGRVASDKLLAANHAGQYVWTEMLSRKFREFNYNDRGEVVEWQVAGIDKDVKINPRLAFGAPQVEGVRTSVLKMRWMSGEEIGDLAEDYTLQETQVLEALIFEGIDSSNPRIAKWLH